MLGYPGNRADIAGDAGKLCPRCAGCHRRCQGNSRRHPAGKGAAGEGAWQRSPASPACMVAHALGARGLALPLPAPWGTGEVTRRGLYPWGHCHPTWGCSAGLVEQGQGSHSSPAVAGHSAPCPTSHKTTPRDTLPCLQLPPISPWAGLAVSPPHGGEPLHPCVTFSSITASAFPSQGSGAPGTPQDFSQCPKLDQQGSTITSGRVSPHLRAPFDHTG